MRIVRNGKKVKMGRESPKEKKLVNGVGSKANKPKGKDAIIGPGKPKGFSKSPWEGKM